MSTGGLRRLWAGMVLWGILLGGCSTPARLKDLDSTPPLRSYENLVESGRHLLEVDDSLEGFNRGSYRFNYYFDEYLFIPLVHGYEFVLPNYVQGRLSNAFENVGEFGNLTNSLLQFKLKSAGITVGRFVVNSTVGIAGLWDPATAWGLRRVSRNFGQTLACYGAGSGSYLVLPILGPSNVRDASGMLVDTATASLLGPATLWSGNSVATIAYTGASAVDKRHRVAFRYRQTGSPFEYELLRMLNSMAGELSVAD
jgi:phospholipid-binding lipoprotein MlaA